MASTQAAAVPARPTAVPHRHVLLDVCPTCEQPIPHDRAEEIARRLEARERERSATITARLQQQFAAEKALALQEAEREASEKIEAAQKAAREAAEAEAQERLDEVQAGLDAKIEEIEGQKQAADTARQALQDQLDEVQRTAEAREAEIRTEAAQAAEAAMKAQLTQVAGEKAETERAKAALEEQLAAQKLAAEQAAAQLKADADAKVAAAEAKAQTLEETHQATLDERLREQREALEAAQAEAVNAAKAAAFAEHLKLSTKVDELQRALDNKTAEELGEGAEIDLFEALKGEFDGDRIERVNKGQQGADILHTVIHNGRECGTIIYDSKNHAAWRNSFVTKLQADQMAAKAEHAILSTRKFPADARHLHVQDGVILASPSRVVALVQIIRQHLVTTHTLRLSNEARTQKTAELYDFITSERCRDLIARFDTHAEDLLDLQIKEKKAHDATWKRQGELLRSVQKVRAELCNEIDMIIGTAQSPPCAP